MPLRVVTPLGILFEGIAESVTLPGAVGQMTILPGHAAFVGTLRKGALFVGNKGEQKSFEVNTGVVHVGRDHAVTLLVRN